MRIALAYCINCGADYKYQASGHYCLETPQEYNDKDYCPECKKAIIDALAPIEKKSFIGWVETDDVDLETLQRWETEKAAERKMLQGNQGPFLPLMKRVFPTLLGQDTIHTRGREEFEGRFYHCLYWIETNELISLTTKVRTDGKGKHLEYLRDD